MASPIKPFTAKGKSSPARSKVKEPLQQMGDNISQTGEAQQAQAEAEAMSKGLQCRIASWFDTLKDG